VAELSGKIVYAKIQANMLIPAPQPNTAVTVSHRKDECCPLNKFAMSIITAGTI
jgi:hypothetical protein